MIDKTSQKRRALKVGDKVLKGRYEVVRILHTKGMSNVYIVFDTQLSKQWCMKEIVKTEAGRDNIEYTSIIKEAHIMRGLTHEGVPGIADIDDEGDSTFIIMDFVDGKSIKQVLHKEGKIPEDVAVDWVKQICQVLGYLHNLKHPIIYRDMKPDNVMVQNDGKVKVLDFGISEVVTETNKVQQDPLGTKGFAAPEQRRRGARFDTRSDIFALGRTFYYMLTGLNPSQLEEGSFPKVSEVVPSISQGVEKIVYKCMEKEPANRYQSLKEVLTDLQLYGKQDISYKNSLKKCVKKVTTPFLFGVLFFGAGLVSYLLLNSSNVANLALLILASIGGLCFLVGYIRVFKLKFFDAVKSLNTLRERERARSVEDLTGFGGLDIYQTGDIPPDTADTTSSLRPRREGFKKSKIQVISELSSL